jgi:hypothetical protein
LETAGGFFLSSTGVRPQLAPPPALPHEDRFQGFKRLRRRLAPCGTYAAKILTGTKRGDPPLEQASKFTFVINPQKVPRNGGPPRLKTGCNPHQEPFQTEKAPTRQIASRRRFCPKAFYTNRILNLIGA